jgi:transposase
VRPQAEHEHLQQTRERQQTPEWKRDYDRRAGIEGTLSQGIRAFELRQTRYLGQAKTHLHHVITAVAINSVRIIAWLQGRLHAPTRQSRFAALRPAG